MNRGLGLKILRQIMNWDEEKAWDEFKWLSFMSAYKYDGYEDYLAGVRFIENLANWLQQFSSSDRKIAYSFIKNNLIYFNNSEINRLVEKFYSEIVQNDLLERVSKKLKIPKFMVWSAKESIEEYELELRKTLFMGLSDGARIDCLRRLNIGSVSNEQVVIVTQIGRGKWKNLIEKLNHDISEIRQRKTNNEKFSRVYLIDDFTASGTNLLCDPKSNGEFKGKLVKFGKSTLELDNSPFDEHFQIGVHHFVGTEKAKIKIDDIYKTANRFFQKEFGLNNIQFSYGMLLSDEVRITKDSDNPFSKLAWNYYDDTLEDGEHWKRCGIKSKKYGYANCGLPVVFEHNTPNNSLALLWAGTNGREGTHKMRPLFRRRERHSDMRIED